MPTWNSVAAFTHDFDKMMGDLTGPEKRKITRAQGEEAQRIAAKAATHDLGSDRAFSGWTRATPIVLETHLRNLADGNTLLSPTKASAGPWTVAEFGRNQGNASGFAGPGVSRSTGLTARTKSGRVRKVRARRARRWNGTTRPKSTASEAVKVMEKELPKIADKAVTKVIRKRFDVT
jgi:hypothetical protein